MIIEKLVLHEGFTDNIDYFSEKRNLIYSKKNTKGKSTYLRLLFYALGYSIPNMKGVRYKEITTELTFIEKDQKYIAKRTNNLMTLYNNNNKLSFILPSDHMNFLSYIFKYDNINVLKNLLGVIYIDQEKGWTLLNRGTVIGKIKFSIEELLAGLNGVDIEDLFEKRKNLKLNKDKYTALLDIHKLREDVYKQNGEIFVSDVEKDLNKKIAYCKLKILNEENSLKEIVSIIDKEKQFYEYIDSMNLSVKQNDTVIPVNRTTLLNSTLNYDYLKSYKNVIATNIKKLKREQFLYETKLKYYYEKNMQIDMLSNESGDKFIDKQLMNFNIDQNVVNGLLEKTKKELRSVNEEIKNKIKKQNSYINKIYQYVLEYSRSLSVEDKINNKQDFIFTSDLKSFSGAVLQKIVFAFKVAFLKVIEEHMNTKLFIVIDSPKGKELDDDNMKLIENIITSELNENQVFLASIYELGNEKMIQINNKAIEGRNL